MSVGKHFDEMYKICDAVGASRLKRLETEQEETNKKRKAESKL